MVTMTQARLRTAQAVGGLLLISSALAGCAADETAGTVESGGSAQATNEAEGSVSSTADADHPDVLAAELSGEGGSYSLSVTMSSEYDTPQRYADGWRVLDPDGNELGTWELGHDHAGEQPFTRTQTGLEIPSGVSEVTVEGRDLVNGYGGATVTIPVP